MDFFESYTFKLLTDTYYYVMYEDYENAHTITGMNLETMLNWIQSADTIEELPPAMQTLVRLVEKNFSSSEEDEKEAERIMNDFLQKKLSS